MHIPYEGAIKLLLSGLGDRNTNQLTQGVLLVTRSSCLTKLDDVAHESTARDGFQRKLMEIAADFVVKYDKRLGEYVRMIARGHADVKHIKCASDIQD